jgi:hypothetical protein
MASTTTQATVSIHPLEPLSAAEIAELVEKQQLHGRSASAKIQKYTGKTRQ